MHPRVEPYPAVPRPRVGVALFRTLLVLVGLVIIAQLVVFGRMATRSRDDISALTACLENTAYSRDLIGQCLDDYAQMGK